MSVKTKVLFVCTHNSARSQMAEALLNHMASDRFEAMSAGIDPGVLNPLAIEVMREIGIDIRANKTKMVFELYRAGKMFQYIIGVCDNAAMEKCPIFPGVNRRVDWSFPDPSAFTGSEIERLQRTREVRDLIESKLKNFIESVSD